MKNKDFAVFILTHGRPDKVITYKTLKKNGYTGKIVVLVDNEDATVEKYKEKFGDEVHVFNKEAIARKFDEADNFNDRRSIVYARNACFEVAKKMGIKYFLELDDDYSYFAFAKDDKGEYILNHRRFVRELDPLFDAYLDFYKGISAHSIAMAQGGDFIGGEGWSGPKRKCMNTFFCSTDRPFQFLGRINEDVNTYVAGGGKGLLFMTFPDTMINQAQTQSSEGGMTNIYVNKGTYVKSFYTVIFAPSCVKITVLKDLYWRLHHRVTWKNAVPVLLASRWKKDIDGKRKRYRRRGRRKAT